jgi:hypothetical protein
MRFCPQNLGKVSHEQRVVQVSWLCSAVDPRQFWLLKLAPPNLRVSQGHHFVALYCNFLWEVVSRKIITLDYKYIKNKTKTKSSPVN